VQRILFAANPTTIRFLVMATHRADEKALLDDRGYDGPLIRGQNPALLFEKGVRDRITESLYWKEQCFGLNAATLCDRAAELTHIGGTHGYVGKPTPFLCLAFKLIQLVPDKEIILEYLNFTDDEEEPDDEDGGAKEANNIGRRAGEFKYLRALAAFYIRLAWKPVDIYMTLEPLLSDYRKLKRRTRDGFILTHMDEFVDDLLTKDRVCATSLWKMQARDVLEEEGLLEPRVSPIADELDEEEEDQSDNDAANSSGQESDVAPPTVGNGYHSPSPSDNAPDD